MKILKDARLKLGLSLRQLGQRSGVNFRALGEIEAGLRLPSAEIVAGLRTCLGANFSMPTPTRPALKKVARGIARARPFALEAGYLAIWEQGLQDHRRLILQIEPLVTPPIWFADTVRLDSPWESLVWLQLLSGGAQIDLDSPNQMGFRTLPVVDCNGKWLAERHLPYLIWRGKSVKALIWPQLTVKAGKLTYRPDGLAQVRLSPRRKLPVVLEFDGRGHDPTHDAYRTRQLGLPVIRFSYPEVESLQLCALLEKRLLEL